MMALRHMLVALCTLALLMPAIAKTHEHCPRSIKATIPGYLDSYNTEPLHQQLIDCADSVQHLNLRITLLGCSEHPERYTLPFCYGDNAIYPALKSLKLEGYKFDEIAYDKEMALDLDYWRAHPVETPVVLQKALTRWWHTPASARSMTNLELWVQAMDWTALETLDLEHKPTRHFFDVAWPQLTGLKHLRINDFARESYDKEPTMVGNAIARLPEGVQLETLRWRGVPAIGRTEQLEKVLGRHGSSLRQLDMGMDRPQPSYAITTEEARLVARLAPELEHVSVVISGNGTGTWPMETLEALAALPKLKRLKVGRRLESDCVLQQDSMHNFEPVHYGYDHAYEQPELTEAAAREMYERLQVDKLVLYTGDFQRPWDGPVYFADDFEGIGVWSECERERTMKGGVVCRVEFRNKR